MVAFNPHHSTTTGGTQMETQKARHFVNSIVALSVMLLLSCASTGDKKKNTPQQTASGAPRIEFAELTHDFGKASQNQSLKHSFSFKNTGTGVLVIDKVRSSCGCTAALASGKEIQPGQTGTIDVTFNTGTRQGKNEKTITVTTNDPLQQTVTLKIAADIEVVLALQPQQLVMGQIKKNEPIIRYAGLIGNDKNTAKIISAESSHKLMKVAVNNQGFDNNPEKKIKITVLPGLKPGRFQERVTITTDHPSVKTLMLPVSGEVMGNILVSPQMVSFGVLQQGQKIERTINLKASGKESFKVTKADSDNPAISAVIEKVVPDKEYNVKIAADESVAAPGAILRGKILISTTDKDQATIEIPYWGRVARQSQ